MHFTPTYSSWINLVERWFAASTDKQIRRGTHKSVKRLEDTIRKYIDVDNQAPKPLIWTKSADEILLTLDLEFGDLRKYPPGSHPGIILFRPRSMGPRFVGRVVLDFVGRTDLTELAGCLVVVDPDRVRVRYPPLDTEGDEWTDAPL